MNDDLPKTSRRITQPFQLGELEILPASNEVRGRRGVERLRPLLMDILLRLAAQPGEVVRRETLLEDVWARRMVNDEVLSRAIAELRTALGDDARSARYIETIPKIGYRLVASMPARPEPASKPPAARIPRAAWWISAGVLAAALAWILLARPVAAPDAGIEKLLAAARPFTSDPALELAPRFSPDGRSVAYVLGAGNESRIVIQPLDGSARRTVEAKGALLHSPVWFPDGERIAFWSNAGGECAIVERNLKNGAEKTLVKCALAPRPRFDLSSDGRQLVFTGNTRPQYPAGLWLASVDGSAPAPLTAPDPGMGDDLFPRFSPDGKRIAFFRGNESHRQPWIVPRDDPSHARAAARVEGLSYGIAWLANDGPLLAAADWLGVRAINVLDPASGKARLAGARGARFPDVSRNGDIVYESAIYGANLWLVDVAGTAEARALWRSTRYSNQPEFSPDGRRVVFASNREGFDALYVSSLDGEPVQLAAGEKFRYIRPHWSADGRSVYAVRITMGAQGGAVQHAVRIPADGGAGEVLRALGDNVNSVVETRDGRWLYFGELAGHAMRLMRASAAGGAVERLPLPLVAEFQLNAERLVFAQPQLERLTSCRLSDLACEPLALEVGEADQFHWQLGPRSIFVRSTRGEKPRVERFDLARRAVTQTLALFPTGTGTSLAPSPDESRLLVVREEGPAVDLMIARPNGVR